MTGEVAEISNGVNWKKEEDFFSDCSGITNINDGLV